jgi:hypothetical protein
METLNSYKHFKVAPSDSQAKSWQREGLTKSTIGMTENQVFGKEQRKQNSNNRKVAIHCLNQALNFYRSLSLVESEVLRNHHPRVAPKR